MSKDFDSDLYPLADSNFPDASFYRMHYQANMYNDDNHENNNIRQIRQSNYKPRNPQRIEELTKYELKCLEKRRQTKNFYKKHPVLHFLREYVVPKPYYCEGPSYLDKFV